MRATTRRKRTADATIKTSTSGSPIACQKRTPGAIKQAPASSPRRRGVRRARDSSAGSSSVRIEGWSAAAPQSK